MGLAPDWNGAFDAIGHTFLPSFEPSDVWFLLPARVGVADLDGMPDVALDFFSEPGGAGPYDAVYVMLRLRLVTADDFDGATEALRSRHPAAQLVPIPFAAGAYLTLKAPNEEARAIPFAWDAGSTAEVAARLSATTGTILYQWLDHAAGGGAPLRASASGEIAAFVPRPNVRVAFKTGPFLTALAGLGKVPGTVDVGTLHQRIVSGGSGLPWTVDGATSTSWPDIAGAVVARVRTELGQFDPVPTIGGQGVISLRDAATLPAEVQWDLAAAALAPFQVVLDLDPFAAVAELLATRGRDAFVHVTTVPDLPTTLRTRRVLVNPVLPPNLVGIEAVTVELDVDAAHSPTGSAQHHTVPLLGQPAQTVVLSFVDPSDMPWSWRAAVVTDEAQACGDPHPAGGDYLAVTAADLPVEVVTIGVADGLAGMALVELSGEGLPAVTLDDERYASFALPGPPAVGATVTVRATWRQDAASSMSTVLPLASRTVGTWDFPQGQPQHVDVTVRFGSADAAVTFAFQGEDDESLQVVTFTTAEPKRTVTYSPRSPFRSRFRYRRDGAPGNAWSAYLNPAPLSLEV